MNQSEIPENLWNQYFNGQRLACARLITKVENYPHLVPEIRNRIFPHLKQAVRIGITGPPGVGKSTITAALARQALDRGEKVGIIAVDPSSPFTGGAFLGDRVRMQNLIRSSGVFIRSLASRSGGGISPATPYVADVFDAFGMDLILIETVGVGQAELDVLTCSDLIMLVLQPSTGDIIQMLKAGIMETADMFVINKSDLPGCDQLADYIRFIFASSTTYDKSDYPPVLKASARENTGIDTVYETLKERIDVLSKSGRFTQKRRERLLKDIVSAVKEHLWTAFLSTSMPLEAIQSAAADLADQGRSPYPLIHKLCQQVKINGDAQSVTENSEKEVEKSTNSL